MNTLDQIFLDEKASIFINAFDASNRPMIICENETDKIIYANQSFMELMGFKEKDLIDRTYKDLNMVNRKSDLDRIFMALEEKGSINEYPILLNSNYHEIKYCMLSISIFKIKDRFLRFTVLDDKTDLYLTQAEINRIEEINKEDNERYRALLESTRDLVWIVDPVNYGLLMYNRPFIDHIRSKGFSPALGMTPGELLRPENVPVWTRFFEKAVSEGSFSTNYITETGNLNLILTISPLKVGSRLVGISVFGEDVTEQERYKGALEESNKKLNNMFNQTIQAISRLIEMKDPYTAGRQRRVKELAVAIGQELKLSEERLEMLSLGALIHDIGKMFVPEDVLIKTDELLDYEVGYLKSHPENAYDIVSKIDFPESIPKMILQHHERMDGSGYPLGLAGEEIILEARIIAVADVVEAMNYNRAYREAPGMTEATREIERHKGTRYDEKVVDACLRVIREKGFAFGI